MPTTDAFVPTPAQRRFLGFTLSDDMRDAPTIRAVCARARVHYVTYYRWCQDPAFAYWFTSAWTSSILMAGWHCLGILRDEAGDSIDTCVF